MSQGNCSHCGFPLPASGGGLRHYGTHTAHAESECLRLLQAEIDRLRARALELEAQCEAGAASEQRWVDWLVAIGLLHYYDRCKRPDETNGQAWVLRKPAVIDGSALEAWHPDTAAGALRAFLGKA